MKLIQNFLVNNECYKKGVKITVKGLMLHSTGANNPYLKRYVQPDIEGIGKNTNNNDWNRYRPDNRQVCVHGFIGKLANGAIATVQTLPWNFKGWHAGKATGNNLYIGIEICEDGLNDRNYFNAVYNEAVEVYAYLCEMFNLNPLTDIICHSEGYKKGVASNHSDVMHWFPKHGKSMDTFRNDVKNKIGNVPQKTETSNATTPSVLTNYTVKINSSDGFLNVRNEPNTNSNINTTVKNGEIYTIVAESNNWGKLKSGAGWIYLKYTDRNTNNYYPACDKSHVSITKALKSIGVDSSYENRKKIAQKNNVRNYTGTADQNNQLLSKLKAGRLVKI